MIELQLISLNTILKIWIVFFLFANIFITFIFTHASPFLRNKQPIKKNY